ncbi:LysR family transcriptional regulator [Dyella terrae]|uniref:LysR family transcriptional regulator n=1 Tax=Dyella terrae TaxID=522259 RepID=UPI001EFD1BE6|nr:LysR family transcriptional regulator [Dyella terrae]ULU26663.1 LysR family transcriptional regulator [Dyella terrae]
MDRFESMAVFVEIVRTGSLTATAERFGLSPSMVGKHLNALEARLGTKLLHRTTRRHQLTEAGALYFERCRDILDRVEAADDDAAALRGDPSGQLRIAAPISFGVTQLAPAMAAFQAKYPGVDIELVLTDAPVDPVGDGIDLAFRIGPLADSSLIARSLPPYYRMVVCASPDYLARRGTPATPDDLLTHDCLGHTRWGPRHAWRFEGHDGLHEVPVTYRLRVDNGPALREAALAGGGIILQPLGLVKTDLETGRLRRLLEGYSARGRDFYLLYARDVELPAKLRAFVEFALDHFSTRDSEG